MDNRARNWAFIAYPESLPENWKDVLSDFHIPAFISPLHNKDVTSDGELKKEHYHIMMMFQGKKSLEQILDITDALNCTRPVVIHDTRSYARYLVHMDETDENKYHYDKSDVIALGGACYDDVIMLPSDTEEIIREIEIFIAENDVKYYQDFSLYLAKENPEWHKIFRTHTVHFSAILRSLEYKEKQNNKH